jgi:hypothetical protein
VVDTAAKTVTIGGTQLLVTYTITTSGHTAPCTATAISGTVTRNLTSNCDWWNLKSQRYVSGAAITTTVYTFGGACGATMRFTYWIDFCVEYSC